MKIFATRVWGFDPATWPLITFGLEGNRDRLLQNSEIGDYILFVGTQNEPTEESDRGRLLGISHIGRVPVDSLSVLAPSAIGTHDYDERGNFRWPKALVMTRAWKFKSKPLLREVLAEQLPYNATTQAVLLNEADTNAIMNLEAEEVPIPLSESIENLRTLEIALERGRPTRGVIPVAWSQEIIRTFGSPSVTYLMRYGNTDCWKIGHTKNVKERLAEINRHVPHELTGVKWTLTRTQQWPDEEGAYKMEQKLFNLVTIYRTEGERVRCSEKILHDAWIKSIGLM